MISFAAILFVAISNISFLDCAPFDGKLCITNYLRNKELISDNFRAAQEITSSCLNFIKSTEMTTLLEVKNKLDEKEELKNSSECIVDRLKEVNFVDYAFKAQILSEENYDVTDGERIEEMTNAMQKLIELSGNAIIDCYFSDQFGAIFDSIMTNESQEDEELSDEDDYCVRKHIIEHKLIDTTKYILDANPKNLDTSSINCEDLYNNLVIKIKDQMVAGMKEIDIDESSSSNISDKCVLNVVDSYDYVNKLEYFDYLKEFELSSHDVEQEKEKFVHLMKDMTKMVMYKCVIE
ncbi:unnamed protein product [Chironomus riparius]|uniref:Uncharacterized protein n=1 Tax=Chironomus riparius TaxID=315576 RepID=A0A9N9RIT1_9DIPT|nr:unnamed protein product [Chironomus riparius]